MSKYSQSELEAAFLKVANKKDWKYPISAVIDPSDRDIVNAAIDHFVYGGALFEKLSTGKLRVRAQGYYNFESSMGM